MAKRKYVGLLTRQCERCGTDVTRKASAFKAHTFCTRTCYLKSEYHAQATSVSTKARRPNGRTTFVCHCGKSVERFTSQVGNRNYCSRECRTNDRIENPTRQPTSHGYVRVYVGLGAPGAMKSGHILEHRLVMQARLGRPLLRSEDVHHINGDRTDNRDENLELWSHSQPRGQRIQDKLEWAREFIRLYEDVPIA